MKEKNYVDCEDETWTLFRNTLKKNLDSCE